MTLFRVGLLWQQDVDKWKHDLVSQKIVCPPKGLGGLGVQNLETMNNHLLSKWLWKPYNIEGGCKTILRRRKYKGDKCIHDV